MTTTTTTESSAIEKLYRFEDVQYTNGLRVHLQSYAIIKETAQGWWVALWPKKWVSRSGKKRFAYPTVEEAKQAYIHRKERQIVILQAKLSRAKSALVLVQEGRDFAPQCADNLLA